MSPQAPTADRISNLVDDILAQWADQGKVVEAGWWAYVATSGLATAPELQRTEMRKAYMLGAQHLYATLMSIMDEDREPTTKDLRRMELIHKELEAFRLSLTN